MSLKELFQDKQKKEKLSQQQVEQEVQSEDYLNEFIDKTNEFVPQVDFSKPENFAFFGSAEKYYSDAFDRILNLYPYDGSKSEKLKWRNESTLIDRWVYDNKYPKSTGYAVFSADGWGTLATSKASGYGSPTTQEYIYVKGGPNTGSTTLTTLKDAFTTANIYDATNKQTSNLLFDLASDDGGITVEFWLNKTAFDNTKTEKEVIFDLWNGETSSSTGYGRFTLELTSSGSPFLVTAQSGTNGVFQAAVGSNINSSYVLDGWHHYSFTVFNNSSQIGINFYTDGQLSEQISTGTFINEVTGTLTAYVGALRTAVSGTSTGTGWGKLSASLDEFRFWKTKRTSKDIGRYWWANVDGGSNTDDYGIYLGIYYKFNEGVVGTTSRDQIVIDYSGRTTNGYWYGYGSNSRSTGSAFTAYISASYTEVGDPILYSSHSEYTNQLTALTATGSIHDSQNNSKLYTFFPSWVVDNDIQHGEELSKLTQIAASYFDTLYLQVQALTEIKNNFATIKRQEGVLDGTNELNQITGTLPTYDKPLPFAKTLVDSTGFIAPEILTDATLLETLLNRNENINYDDTISDIKNTIYFNLYSTLINAFKTKGTKRSYNNILHSFGVDERLVKINTYPINTTLYFDDNTNLISQKRKVVDFNNSDRYMGTVHQYYDASNPNSISFISGSIANSSLTIECETLFPYKVFNDQRVSKAFFTESSIFGGHTAQSNTDLTWATNDYFNFVVKAHRPNTESTDAYFELSSSVFGSLTSSLYYDIYNNEKWNFAVKVYPTKYENIDLVSGADGTYTVEFYGVNVVSNAIQNVFTVTGTVSNTTGDNAVTSNKRLFVGAHYNNFTSSVLQYSDTKVSYLRYWNTELTNDSILQHAFDTYNYGTEKPANSAYLNTTGSYIPEIETLTLEWSFNQVTGSDVNGQFIVQDLTSGSVGQNKGYPNWFNNISKYQYTGRGFEFPESSTQVVDTDYFATEKLKLPEIINSSDMINILTEDDEAFTADSRPELYVTRFEKSMYQNISEEMVNMFGTLVEFNNYIGRPIHKYRTEYKDLRYLRELFFSKVQNEPDLDKYLELYKWFDTSIGVFLAQLTPTTSQVTTKLENVIESHILERPKYQHKYLAINSKLEDPEDSVTGVNSLLYNWKVGHRPLTNSEQQNALYWKERAERTGARAAIHSASLQIFNRNQSSPYRFTAENRKTFKGGVNFDPNKNLDFVKIHTAPHGALDADEMIQPPANYLFVGVEDTSSLLKVEDTLDPTKKRKYSFKVVSGKEFNPSSQGYSEVIDSTIALPANFISGTVVGGYHDQVAEQFISGVIITNIHNDTYGSSNEIPIQGPFTAQWVGGNQSRHIDLNTGNDSYLTRPEAWKILLGLGLSGSAGLVGNDQYQAALGWVGADYPFPEGNDFEPSYPVVAHKRATYLREETAKRPVNIKNIQSTTTAASRLGNYRSNYEVIHTFGRTNNDRELIDAVNPGTQTELSGILRTNTTGRVDFTLPTRQVLKTVVGSRFSAPGGSRYSSRGYLNRYAEELSAYNAMSFRNREVIGSPHGLGSTPNVEVVSGALGTGSLLALAKYSDKGYVSGGLESLVNYENAYNNTVINNALIEELNNNFYIALTQSNYTASLTGSDTPLLEQETIPTGIYIGPSSSAPAVSGAVAYIVGTTNKHVMEYILPTPYSLSGAVYSGNRFDVSPYVSEPNGIFFKPDGTRMFILDSSSIVQYGLSTPWDISTSTYTVTSTEFANYEVSGGLVPAYLDYVPDDPETETDGGSTAVAAPFTKIQDFYFHPNGTDLYVISGSLVSGTYVYPEKQNRYNYFYVYQIGLSSSWDLTSGSLYLKDFIYGEDWTTVQVTYLENIGQYSLYDLSSSNNKINFSFDGDRLVVCNRTRIIEYPLSSSYNINSRRYYASLGQTWLATPQDATFLSNRIENFENIGAAFIPPELTGHNTKLFIVNSSSIEPIIEDFTIYISSSLLELPSAANTIPSYHKINKNPVYSVVENSEILEPDYDNAYQQHTIPQNDAGYKWLRDSLLYGAVSGNVAYTGHKMGYTVPSGSSSTNELLMFVTSGTIEDSLDFSSVDFSGLNTVFNDSLVGSSYPKQLGLIEKSKNKVFQTITSSYNYDSNQTYLTGTVYKTNNNISSYVYTLGNRTAINNLKFERYAISPEIAGYEFADVNPFSTNSSIRYGNINKISGITIKNNNEDKVYILFSGSYGQQNIYQYSKTTVERQTNVPYEVIDTNNNYFTSYENYSQISLVNEFIDKEKTATGTNITNNSFYYANTGITASIPLNLLESSSCGLQFKTDGTKLYTLGLNTGYIYQYELGTSWDLLTVNTTSNIFSSSISPYLSGSSDDANLFFKPDGTKFYINDPKDNTRGSNIYEYVLSTPWDITTSTYSSYFSAYTASNYDLNYSASCLSFAFNENGTILYLNMGTNDIDYTIPIGTNNSDLERKLYQFPLNTPWDITSCSSSYLQNNVLMLPPRTNKMFFNSDYTKLFLNIYYIVTPNYLDPRSELAQSIIEFAIDYDYDIYTPILNKILLNRNGPYGYSSFNQIRNMDKKIVKDCKINNYITVTKKIQTTTSDLAVSDFDPEQESSTKLLQGTALLPIGPYNL